MTRPTVWVLKEQVVRGTTGSKPMDYTAAYEFGDIKFITEFDPPIHPSSTLMEEWERQFRRFASEFNPDVDSVILTGSPLAIAKAGKFFGELRSAFPIRVLVWRREQGRYVPTIL